MKIYVNEAESSQFKKVEVKIKVKIESTHAKTANVNFSNKGPKTTQSYTLKLYVPEDFLEFHKELPHWLTVEAVSDSSSSGEESQDAQIIPLYLF